jgi:hypothetical protein
MSQRLTIFSVPDSFNLAFKMVVVASFTETLELQTV